MCFQPAMFHEGRIEVMHKMMAEHPFATVVSAATGGFSADHIPLVLRCGPTKKAVLGARLPPPTRCGGTPRTRFKSWRFFKGHSHM